MSIEVRQLLIKSQLVGEAPPSVSDSLPQEKIAQVKEEILSECRAWLADKLQDIRER